jgi:hypothetical protein
MRQEYMFPSFAISNFTLGLLYDRGIIVEKMVEYMSFKTYYESVNPKEDVPVKEFLERIPPEIVLELLLAADYQESASCRCSSPILLQLPNLALLV